MGDHHEESPSRYPAWAECLDWIGNDRDTQSSTAGTDTHKEIQDDLDGKAEAESYKARWAVGVLHDLAGEGTPIQSEVHLVGNVGRVKGIYGTADAMFSDHDGVLHIADFKTFSDGTKNYRPQLYGYAALSAMGSSDWDRKVVFHILHGGICKVETFDRTIGWCTKYVEELLARHDGCHGPCLCSWCSFCGKVKECSQVSNAVQVVKDNNPDVFGRMTLCQKLVVLDAVDKMSKELRESAKELARKNGGVLEQRDDQGNVQIRYEMKPWAGKPKVDDICKLAGSAKSIKLMHKDRKGNFIEVPCNGLSNDEFIKLCGVSKTALVDAIKAKNADDKAVTKADIERWLKEFFIPTEGEPHFVRTV